MFKTAYNRFIINNLVRKEDTMKIVCLVENTSINPELKPEHGISFYIEIGVQKILFDLGQGHLFIENAQKLGIDLTLVDTVVISHGHYDHGGGLNELLKINNHAKIYIHENAFMPHYSENIQGDLKEIGLDPVLKVHNQVILTGSTFVINPHIQLFSKLNQSAYYPSGNKLLKQCLNDVIQEDDFSHEQNMILMEDNQTILFAGCAHKGILNIVNQAIQIMHLEPSHVFAGFHLHSRSTGLSESETFILELGSKLAEISTIYHTGHCTGLSAIHLLQQHWNDRFLGFSTGLSLTL